MIFPFPTQYILRIRRLIKVIFAAKMRNKKMASEENEQQILIPADRQPWLGVCLNAILPGAGHFYARHYVRGILWMLGGVLLMLLFFLVFFYTRLPLLVLVFLSIVSYEIFLVFLLMDIFRCIKKSNAETFERERRSMKDPWLAVFLSFFIPGLGYLYLRYWYFFILALGLNLVLWFLGTFDVLPGVWLIGFFVNGLIFCHIYWIGSQYPYPWKKMKSVILLWCFKIIALFPLFLLVILVMVFWGQIYTMTSDSMSPAIKNGDRVLVNKTAYLHAKPEAGDIITYYPPSGDGFETDPYLSRIVAVEGQTITMKEGTVYVDDNSVQFGPVRYSVSAERIHIAQRGYLKRESYVVPDESVFVLGDYFIYSRDSRDFGPIRQKNMIGKVVRIIDADEHAFIVELTSSLQIILP